MKKAMVALGVSPNRRVAWAVAATAALFIGVLIWAFGSGHLALVTHKVYTAEANNGRFINVANCHETVYYYFGDRQLQRRVLTEGVEVDKGGWPTGMASIGLVDKKDWNNYSHTSIRFAADNWVGSYTAVQDTNDNRVSFQCMLAKDGVGL